MWFLVITGGILAAIIVAGIVNDIPAPGKAAPARRGAGRADMDVRGGRATGTLGSGYSDSGS